MWIHRCINDYPLEMTGHIRDITDILITVQWYRLASGVVMLRKWAYPSLIPYFLHDTRTSSQDYRSMVEIGYLLCTASYHEVMMVMDNMGARYVDTDSIG